MSVTKNVASQLLVDIMPQRKSKASDAVLFLFEGGLLIPWPDRRASVVDGVRLYMLQLDSYKKMRNI